jgi:hypothetical protein
VCVVQSLIAFEDVTGTGNRIQMWISRTAAHGRLLAAPGRSNTICCLAFDAYTVCIYLARALFFFPCFRFSYACRSTVSQSSPLHLPFPTRVPSQIRTWLKRGLSSEWLGLRAS